MHKICLIYLNPSAPQKMSLEISIEETLPDGISEVGHFNMPEIL